MGAIWGAIWAHLGPSGAHLGATLAHFEPSGSHLGAIQGQKCFPEGLLGSLDPIEHGLSMFSVFASSFLCVVQLPLG